MQRKSPTPDGVGSSNFAFSTRESHSPLSQRIRLIRGARRPRTDFFLRRVHELVTEGSQFVIATHSPIVLAYPEATILACTESGLDEVAYDEAEPVRLTRGFRDTPASFLRALLSD